MHESAHSPEHCNTLTRRSALVSTAACGALALPAGAALAVELPGDPGLAALERGYARWRQLHAKADALGEVQDAAYDRARARLPEPEPEPEPPSSDIEYFWKRPVGHVIDAARDPKSPVTLPREFLDQYDAFVSEWHRWSDRRPTLDGDPDYEESEAIERERERLWSKAWQLRRRLLKIPTRSPKGLMIKVALAVEAKSFGDVLPVIEDEFRHDNLGEDFLPAIVADLQAMVTAA